MRITAYIHPLRTAIAPTGVGKHMIHMVLELARMKDVDLRLLTSSKDLKDGRIDARSPLAHLPTMGHPLSRAAMEAIWLIARRPRADRWASNPDWIYCPAEAYFPARCRTAATIHCVNWFDPEVPWYSDQATRKLRRRMRPRWKAIVDRSDLVLTVSEFLKKRITELFGTDPARLAVVGNGVEEEFFAAGKSPQPASVAEDPYIMVVGGLTQRKGANFVFPVAAELARLEPKIQIRVAGASEPNFVEQSRAHRNIVHIGYQGVDTLPGLMRRSIAVMFLSRYETFGIPAAEAMAAGTPAVVSSFAALPEIVGDGGLIADVQRPDLIAEAILRLRDDSDYRDSLINRGQVRAERYHWSVAAGRLISALKSSGGA